MASIVETYTGLTALNPNQAYSNVFSLSYFARASALAAQFQFYKAARVTWTYEPFYNTFQEAAAAPISKPFMYVQMNRTQVLYTGASLAEIQGAGARPQPFVNMKTISYVPNWCSSGVVAHDSQSPTGVKQLGLQKQYGWLACPSTDLGDTGGALDNTDDVINQSNTVTIAKTVNNKVTYNGHIVYFDQAFASAGTTPQIARMTVTVHWLFKGAHFYPTVAPPPSLSAEAK